MPQFPCERSGSLEEGLSVNRILNLIYFALKASLKDKLKDVCYEYSRLENLSPKKSSSPLIKASLIYPLYPQTHCRLQVAFGTILCMQETLNF
jgi:hypothetical protein